MQLEEKKERKSAEGERGGGGYILKNMVPTFVLTNKSWTSQIRLLRCDVLD